MKQLKEKARGKEKRYESLYTHLYGGRQGKDQCGHGACASHGGARKARAARTVLKGREFGRACRSQNTARTALPSHGGAFRLFLDPQRGGAGKRKSRNQRVGTRIPELGYYLIVIDTEETEKNYFEGLRDSIPKELKNRLIIKVEKAKTVELVEKALEFVSKDSQMRMPWIVFDRDEVKDFDKIIQDAERSGVMAGWSNPCFEIWMYAYFGEMPVIEKSVKCCEKFADKFEKCTKKKYLKNDRRIYQKLLEYGDEKNAIQIAKKNYKTCVKKTNKKPSDMYPASTVHMLVEEIKNKVESPE